MRKAVVLGGYGLIGAACMRALTAEGFAVTGIGRSRAVALASSPDATWVIRDIRAIDVAEWQALLADADVVVNAAGALQDGARDNLEAVHVTLLSRLVEATRGLPLRIVQISAAGAEPAASTEFFRSKARGDAILAAGARNWVILRPVLVLSPEAYGGTALLRGVAALPLILPRVLPEARVQTVHVDDLAGAVVVAAKGQVPSGLVADLTEPGAQSFATLVDCVRHWQGFPAPRFRPAFPDALLRLIGRGADGLGHLGWRSPLRSSALQALSDGIRGDPTAWLEAGGRPCRSLSATLESLPATRQERLFARSYFLLPLAIATLALFWCASGAITLIDPARAMAVLGGRGIPAWIAAPTVFGGALADILLGLAILWRPRARMAALGMIGLSAAYLLGSLVLAPDLWLDPLGPMIKVIPGMVLAAMVALGLEER
ncbi:SDR family oxidoreductase [Xinfangfangia pollutisoli]|uniref:SDR family oxidoreductase n=1 Tax=Xinfangfangia pollutisoli TaxID=2865960 RepID=UPI001CD7B9C3|nr:SDR family oxidoreductase [Xinfangfangia pollutisoli]